MLLKVPCLACNSLAGDPMCDLCTRLEHAEAEAIRERHGTYAEAYAEVHGGTWRSQGKRKKAR